jgi:hypothetical protein
MDTLIIQNSSPPTQPFPPSQSSTSAPAFAPTSPVTPGTWIAGKTYPIVIKGSGFIVSNGEAGSGGCPITKVTASVDPGSVDLTDVTVLDSTTIQATVKTAATDPTGQATITLYGPGEGGCPNGIALPGPQTTAQIDYLNAVITDTSKIQDLIVKVKLTAPSGTKGDLNLDFNGADANGLELSQVPFTALAPGSQNLRLPFDNTILPGIYPMANGTWDATVPGVTDVQSVTVPDYTLPTPWTYFRKVFYTLYNKPHESSPDCTGDEVTAYTIDNSCTITPIQLVSGFVRAAWLNGTGISLHNGVLQNAWALELGSNQSQCAKEYLKHPGAIGQGMFGGNTFVEITSLTGACSNQTLVEDESLAMPCVRTKTPTGKKICQPSVLSGVQALSCGDHLHLHSENYTTAYTRTVADKCPACSDTSPFSNDKSPMYGADGHIDAFSSNQSCLGKNVGSLGFFYTSHPTN